MEVKNCESMLYNIFEKVVEAVMSESGVPFDRLANGKDERSVTARVVMVDTLVGIGMSEGLVSELSGMSQQRVNHLKNAARVRLKGLYGKMLQEAVRKVVVSILETAGK